MPSLRALKRSIISLATLSLSRYTFSPNFNFSHCSIVKCETLDFSLTDSAPSSHCSSSGRSISHIPMKIPTSGNNDRTRSGLNVYDFSEEYEPPADDAMLKYKFLQCVAQGGNDHTEEIRSPRCVSVIDIDICCDDDDGNLCGPSETVGEDGVGEMENDHTEEIRSLPCVGVIDIDKCCDGDDGNLCGPSETVGEYRVGEKENDHTEEIRSPPCVGVIDIDKCCDGDDGNICGPTETVGEDCVVEKEIVGLQNDSTSNGHHLQFTRIDNEDGAVSSEVETESSHEESCTGKDDRVDMNLDARESMSESSPSTSASNCVNNEYGRSLSFCLDGWEMEDENNVVNLSPDYIVFQDIYCTDAQIRFCSSCIQIHGSLTNGNKRSVNSQLGIDDIVDLECHWYGRIETAIVKLHVISEDATGSSDALGPSAALGVQEWIFAVVDSDWPKEQDKIISLSVKYKAIWNVVLDNDTEMDEEALVEHKNILSEKHFFPNFDQPFEDVIYPHGDADAVSLSKRDADLLQPETFINDTIVDFYIKYLSNKIPAEERHRFHFFNSFFFRKLVELDKDPFNASEGRTAFLRVRKWTRKVNLFEKDYIFIPINFNLHWSLIVICHPGEVTNFKDEEVENTPRVPCILHMDSIKGMHAGLKNHIQSYLWEEWKEKQNQVSEEMYSKFCKMRFVQLELPQQENSFDCGLFLLHYVELFLEEVPDNFSPFKITKFSSFLNVDWFPPTEASLKRAPILKLIYDILQNLSGETSSDGYDEEHECIDGRKNKNEADVKLHSDSFEPSKHPHEDLLSCQTSQSIKMTLLEASSTQKSEHLNGKGVVARECFDPDATATVDAQFQTYNQAAHLHQYKNPLPPIEEDTETGEQFVYSPSGRTVSGGLGVPSQTEQQSENSSSDPTTSASDDENYDDYEAGSRENNSYVEDEELRQIDDADQQRSPSMENIDCSLTSPLSGKFEIFGSIDDDDEDDAGDGDEDQASGRNGDHTSDGDVAGGGDEDCEGNEHDDEDRAEAEEQAQDGAENQSSVGGEDQATTGDEVQAEVGDEDFARNFLPIHSDTDIEEGGTNIKCRDDLYLVRHDGQTAKRRRLTDYRSE